MLRLYCQTTLSLYEKAAVALAGAWVSGLLKFGF